MSTYDPDSDVSHINAKSAGEAVPIALSTLDVMREARTISELTQGAFDVTVAPLVRLWGFGAGASDVVEPPSDDEIAEARDRVGYAQLELFDDPPSVTKTADGVECDLSGIAKGYAVDEVAKLLDSRAVRDFMVEIGGEVRTAGKNARGEAWRIGIEKPIRGARVVQRVVPLSGLSMATSGDYRNFYEVDGKLYSHLMDPRTGRPVSHRLASVSVVAHSCMRADALASGLLVLGPDVGFDLAVQQDLTVLFLIRSEDGAIEERPSPSFAQLFEGVPRMEP
jgi:thiamine biosynthesis lipoprotein